MKSIRTEPLNHAAEGDERIRTAVCEPGADSAYAVCGKCGHDHFYKAREIKSREIWRCANCYWPHARAEDSAC